MCRMEQEVERALKGQQITYIVTSLAAGEVRVRAKGEKKSYLKQY